MSIFLTLAIYSLRVSGDMPIQSVNFPWIAIYYLLGIFYAFIALIWFLIANKLSSRNTLPTFLMNFTKNLIKQPKKSQIKPVEDAVDEKKCNTCNKCEMCEKCLETKEKEDAKKKDKTNVEAFVSFLNLVFFFLLLFAIFFSNIYIWIKASA